MMHIPAWIFETTELVELADRCRQVAKGDLKHAEDSEELLDIAADIQAYVKDTRDENSWMQ